MMECTSNSQFTEKLKPLEVIPHKYHRIFQEYPCFNFVQSSVVDDIIYGDESIVVSAPTGSGKTALFELAIIRTLITFENTKFESLFKIIYIAPMKALCEERLVDWHQKFSDFGLNCISVTGDSENIEFKSLFAHNLIITTPEKWDCLTRKWRDNRNLMKVIKLFLIDEIHLLNEESRGPTLEAIVCRMKTIQDSVEYSDDANYKIRFLAMSATVPNVEDIAEWMGKDGAKYFKFSDDVRPVKLNKIVIGYDFNHNSYFKFDLGLNYKLKNLIERYSEGKPTLIFCATRKLVEMATSHLLKNLTIEMTKENKARLQEVAQTLSDDKVKESLIHGCGMHHAGMLPKTRQIVEGAFRNGELPILVATSTLAMGINLPAHLVIVKSTKCYRKGEFRDYSETELTQMVGRAGRPQFDSSATALVLTTTKDKAKFERMVGGSDSVESNLHRHLIEHINAEVVLRTITDMDVAMRWLSSTFLYLRAKKNPKNYGLPTGLNSYQLDRKLLEMCQIELNKLIKAGMLTVNPDVVLEATPTGTLMARYYLSFQTMKLFIEMSGDEILQQVLGVISKCHEFSEMYLRVNDKKYLNLLNKCKNKETIRFPLTGRIKTLDMKINCLIQAAFGCLDVCDHSLITETFKIMRHGERITKCLIEYLEIRKRNYRALLSAIILAKCFTTQLWENSPHILKQLNGIGIVMSTLLVRAGKVTNEAVLKSDARELELVNLNLFRNESLDILVNSELQIMNRKPPSGSKILEQIKALPKYSMEMDKISDGKLRLEITLDNPEDIEKGCTIPKSSLMYLIVGDSDNNSIVYEQYTHLQVMNYSPIVKILDIGKLEYVRAHFISENWVGIDCYSEVILIEKEPNTINGKKKSPKKQTTQILENTADSSNDKSGNYLKTFLGHYDKVKTPGIIDQPQIISNRNFGEPESTSTMNHKVNFQKLSKKPTKPIKAADASNNGSSNYFKKFLEHYDRLKPKPEPAGITNQPQVISNEDSGKPRILENIIVKDSGPIADNGQDSSQVSIEEIEPEVEELDYMDYVNKDELAYLEKLHDNGEPDNEHCTSRNSNTSSSENVIEDEIIPSKSPERSNSKCFSKVKKFNYSPKKISHRDNNPPPEKKQKLEETEIPRKKISWGSPLLINSPLVKYSPKLNFKTSVNQRQQPRDQDGSSQNSSEISSLKIPEKKSCTSLLKRMPRSSAPPFPLADKHFDCEPETDEKSKTHPISQQKSSQTINNSNNSLTVQDICSNSLLEQLGLIRSIVNESAQISKSNAIENTLRKSSKVSSATDYYTQLMTKSQSRRAFDDSKSSQYSSSRDSGIQSRSHGFVATAPEMKTALLNNETYDEFVRGITQAEDIENAYDPIMDSRRSVYFQKPERDNLNFVDRKALYPSEQRRLSDVREIPTLHNRSMKMEAEPDMPNISCRGFANSDGFDYSSNRRNEVCAANQQLNMATRDPRFIEIGSNDNDYVDDDFGYQYLQMVNRQKISNRPDNSAFSREQVDHHQRPDLRNLGNGGAMMRQYSNYDRFHHNQLTPSFATSGYESFMDVRSQTMRPSFRENDFVKSEPFDLEPQAPPPRAEEHLAERRYLMRPHNHHQPEPVFPRVALDQRGYFPMGFHHGPPVHHFDGASSASYRYENGRTRLPYYVNQYHSQPVQFGSADVHQYRNDREPLLSLRDPINNNQKDFMMSKFLQSIGDESSPY